MREIHVYMIRLMSAKNIYAKVKKKITYRFATCAAHKLDTTIPLLGDAVAVS